MWSIFLDESGYDMHNHNKTKMLILNLLQEKANLEDKDESQAFILLSDLIYGYVCLGSGELQV